MRYAVIVEYTQKELIEEEWEVEASSPEEVKQIVNKDVKPYIRRTTVLNPQAFDLIIKEIKEK